MTPVGAVIVMRPHITACPRYDAIRLTIFDRIKSVIIPNNMFVYKWV